MNRTVRLFAVPGVVVMLGVLCTGLYSCQKDPAIPDENVSGEKIEFTVPKGWPAPHFTFANNPLTPAGFRLGK